MKIDIFNVQKAFFGLTAWNASKLCIYYDFIKYQTSLFIFPN